ncbi:SHOCT domain-containing protein [Bacteriovorax sp. BAL6_X]|uniref:SHOCT domain-containing protein n=1 Tax=Bacteriovorax sp. BAL6_X TaxID=1201290 RepID=UPI000591118A|nr:SHOCT domain-containing protein [Bacteriovorax sp. BAL6_X]
MKNSFIVFSFLSILFVSCSGSGPSDTSTKANSGSSLAVQKTEEIVQMKDSLKDTPYSLSKKELDELRADGAISEEDYQELLALSNSTSTTSN